MDTFAAKRLHELILAAQKPLLISDERIDGDSDAPRLADHVRYWAPRDHLVTDCR